MRYQGQFKTIHPDPSTNQEKTYTVTIVTNQGSGDTPLRLGPSPFTTTMDGGSNTIYNPVKYQSATVQIVANEYYFDMYAAKPKDNSVTLTDSSGNVLFTGYVSPNVYDADYNFITETWDVECVDGLSVLKNYDYTPLGGTKDFVSFSAIINACLEKCGCYTNWYISNVTKVEEKASTNGYNSIDNMVISEANFFDEDDKAMKLSEVLEEICKFLGVSAVADGNKVYFMDYDAIKHGSNTYYSYSVGSSSSSSTTSFTKSLTITKDSYSNTGARLSLDTVYSKVTVKDSLYKVKSIIPSLFDDEDLQNAHYVSEDDQRWNYEFTTSCVYGGKESWLDTWETRASDDVYFKIKSRFYENKKYNHYYFTNTGSSTSGPILNALQAEDLTGVAFAKYNIGSGNTESAANAGLDYDSFDNYLMIPNNYSTTTNLKRLEAKTEFAKPFFMSGKTKIIVKGDLILTDRALFPNSPQADNNTNIGYWPHTGTFTSLYDGNFWHGTKLFPKQNIINLKIGLNIGNYGGTYKVPFYPVGEGEKTIREDSKNHEIFYTSFGVQDNVNYLDCIKEKGYKINTGMPTDTVIPAKPRISIYGMDDMVTAFATPAPYTGSVLGCLFIKDFDVVAVDPYEGSDERVNGTDTEYSVEINADYVTELSPIEFKICTSDGKSLNYSSVAYKDGSSYHFVNGLKNTALSSLMSSSGAAGHNGASEPRAEEIMCFRIVNQYSSASKKLSINLFDYLVKPYSLITEPATSSYGTQLTGATYIVNTISYDYIMNTATCELVEKK